MSVKFPFRKEISPYFNTVRRPIAEVGFYSEKENKWYVITMIVDSGADYTLLPKYMADYLNISLKATQKMKTKGIGGQVNVFLLKKKLLVKIGSYRREIIVGIADINNIPPLLGRYSFMETFKVTFDKFTTTFS